MKTSKSIKRGIFVLVAIVIGAGVCFGNSNVYTGSLSVADGGLTAYGSWNSLCTELNWTVDNSTTPGKWHYSYTLTVPVKDISHIIIEASDGDSGGRFTIDNLFSPASDPADWIESIEVQNYSNGGSAPYMPDSIWGIKFDAALDAAAVTVSFDSDRMPVWGDFYSKDGLTFCDGWNVVYNTGFTSNDFDPVAAAMNGAYQNHLLVPDTYIPAPGAVILVCIGTALTGVMRRRRII